MGAVILLVLCIGKHVERQLCAVSCVCKGVMDQVGSFFPAVILSIMCMGLYPLCFVYGQCVWLHPFAVFVYLQRRNGLGGQFLSPSQLPSNIYSFLVIR